MSTLEDRLRETLAERAALSPVDQAAWDKVVARSRRRRLRWQRPTWARLLVPVAAAAAVAAVIVTAATLAGHAGRGPKSPGTASASASPPGLPLPADMNYVVRQIPPVTPFVPINLFADGHQVRDLLWFGYVPGDGAAGIAQCQYNDGGVYNGYTACTAGGLPAGTLARSAGTDGSYNVWAVSYPVTPAARVVFRDAAGHEVARLDVPGERPAPSRPSHGGIALFRYGKDVVTAYRISGDRIGFWWGGNSTWSDVPVSHSALSVADTAGPRPLPEELFGYAPSGTARVALRLAGGRQFALRTIPGWPGSGVVFWGPLTLPGHIALSYDTIVVTYDTAGHVLREVPFIFIG
jgi:hypothetical protein